MPAPEKDPGMTLTPEQTKAARRLLGWSRDDLAGHVGVSATTIWAFESRKRRSPALSIALVRERLESAGVEFIAESGGAGVRLRKGG
jgi:DNA-binding XRE family transcriptional regulator